MISKLIMLSRLAKLLGFLICFKLLMLTKIFTSLLASFHMLDSCLMHLMLPRLILIRDSRPPEASKLESESVRGITLFKMFDLI